MEEEDEKKSLPVRIGNKMKSAWKSFKEAAWNSEKKTVFGRTAMSWAKILGFYFVLFYPALLGMFVGMLAVHLYILDPNVPKYTLESSIIGSTPGLSFKPVPPSKRLETPLIWFNASRNETVDYWVDSINSFLEPYFSSDDDNVKDCNDTDSVADGTACRVYVSTGADDTNPCTPENQFGYTQGKPCVLLKINRLYDWTPENYNEPPSELNPLLVEEFEKGYLYFTCEGSSAYERENLGTVDYYPSQGIPFYYFPFKNQKGYLSPFVFANFGSLSRSMLLTVECRAWANNIVPDSYEDNGIVHFSLMVD